MREGINGSNKLPKIKIREGCSQKLFIVIILPGQDSRVAVPFRKQNDHDAADKTEHGPKAWQMLRTGVCVFLVNEQRVDQDQEGQDRAANPHDHVQSIAQKLDELEKVHGIRCCTKRMKNAGYKPINTDITAVIANGMTIAGCASVY